MKKQNKNHEPPLKKIIEQVSTNRKQELAIKSIAGILTDEEKNEMDQLFTQPEDIHLLQNLHDKGYVEAEYRQILSSDKEAGWQKLKTRVQLPEPPAVFSTQRKWIRYAAVLLLAISGILSYYLVNRRRNAPPPITMARPTIAPAGDKAILQLANGQQLVVQDQPNDTIARLYDVAIIKQHGHLISKELQPSPPDAPVVFNTLKVPRGGKFQLTLSDGSRIWLGADSEIKFPNSFTGNDRTIYVKGEAWLQIAHNPSRPFHVIAGEMKVQVLGTRFMINAYPGNATLKTTLLQGKLMVAPSGQGANEKFRAVVLTPGQQAVIKLPNGQQRATTIEVNKNIDTQTWNHEYFIFQNEDIKNVIMDLGRWYNVKVVFNLRDKTPVFSGKISRSETLDHIITILNKAWDGSHITRTDSTLVVSK
jgi:transmembrane sensor